MSWREKLNKVQARRDSTVQLSPAHDHIATKSHLFNSYHSESEPEHPSFSTESGVEHRTRNNSGDIDVGDITNMSCLGRSDEGHQAALYYQWTTSDPHTGLIVGLAPDQTLRLCRQGPFFQRRVKISQSTNT